MGQATAAHPVHFALKTPTSEPHIDE